LNKKNNADVTTIVYFKLYNIATIITKVAWYWHKTDRKTNRKE
jgi:hypothetical protein